MLKLDVEAMAAAPFLQHALVAAAKAEPEGRTTHAMAESRAAVAANFTTARASAEKSFFSESTVLTVTASGRAWISRGERRGLSLLEEGGAAAQRVDDDVCLDDEIDAIIKPLVCLNIRVLVVASVALQPLWPAAAEEGLAETQRQRLPLLVLIVIIAICLIERKRV